MNENDHKVKLLRWEMASMLLAGDVGGTKTLLGLYSADTTPPRAHDIRRFPTSEFEDFAEILTKFLRETGGSGALEAACFGVAGPVREQVARLTNVPWRIDATQISRRFSITRVRLLNDLAAMAYAVPALAADQLSIIRHGEPVRNGNAALIAPGTGLGEALLHNVGGRFVPAPSEGGHADFAARTEREMELVRALTARFGRTSYEQIVSGPGLVNLHWFVHGDSGCPVVPAGTPEQEQPAMISEAGLTRRCAGCVEVLELFVSALGAEAGNLGLRSVATAGVYFGGGIPAKILPALMTSTFLDAFQSKSPMDALVDAMPLAVILEPNAALLGAAVAAQELSRERVSRGV